ncbi:hypothetical protein LUZ62_039351 [Rhynchospora pubera]|uniref:Vacuolar protein sorting-associated protein 13 VPS13 adaptor binding domain-containing protein n=1 Tax=Rhynchospora pubera TaxID=906938 RepID=A0AAV8F361_9POAL|nr:hypothetical protein LUZ62_039351 [Rhynchospora pubera]
MVFSDFWRAKLAARLRPWLLGGQEPQFDLHVGFLTSQFKAADLSLDSSVLNSALGDSSAFYFKELVLREVQLRVSPWSSPSVDAYVKSLNVVLALRELEPLSRRACSKDLIEEERKRLLASIDPEGSLFHGLVENLSAQSSKRQLIEIITSTILKCSAIHFDEIQFHLQSDEVHIFTLKAQNMHLESSHGSNTSLIKGFISSSITLREKNEFLSVTCTSLEFEMKDNTRIQRVVSFTGLSVFLKFQNLVISAFSIRISTLDCSVSLGIISSILLLLDKVTQRYVDEHNAGTKRGRELWCIVSRRLCPRKFFFTTVDIVRTWQQYFSAYMVLLSIVGYHNETLLRKNFIKLHSTRDCRLKRNVRYQLAVLNQLEERIPVEAIAKGRRIGRRMSSHSTSSNRSWVYFVRVPFLKILSLVWLLLGSTVCIYRSLVHFLGINPVDTCSFVDPFFDVSSVDTRLQHILFLGELKVALLMSERFDPKLTPIHLIISSLIVVNSSGFVKKSLFLGLGKLEVSSGRQNIVLLSDPACEDHLSGGGRRSNLLSNWTQIMERYEEIDAGTTYEGPFFLYEIKSTVYDYGLKQCNLVLGRLNLNLELESILSFHQAYLLLNKILEGIQTFSVSSISFQPEQSSGMLQGGFKSFTKKLKKLWSDIVPCKYMQVSILIESPQIRVRLERDCSEAALPVLHFLLDLGVVELLVTPLTENLRASDMNMKYSYRRHASHECYFRLDRFGISVENLGLDHNSHILGPASMNFNLSVTSDLLESLSCFEDHLSAALRGNVLGVSAFLYLDELLTSLQALQAILSAISSTCVSLDSENPIYSQFLTRGSGSVGSKGKIYQHSQLTIDAILESDPMHIIFKDSRVEEKVNLLKFGLGFSISRPHISFSIKEEQLKVTIDFSQVEALISDPTNDAPESEKVHCFSLSKCMLGLHFETEILVNIELVRLIVADYSLNDLLGGAEQPFKIVLLSSEDYQSVKCKVQGGFIFLETSTLAEYANCLNGCLLLMKAGRSKVFNSSTRLRSSTSPCAQRQNEIGLDLVREVEIDLSQFSLTLAVADEKGVVQELNISADTNLQLQNFGKKFSIDLSCLSISKYSWSRQITSQNNHPLAPHFRSDNSTFVPILRAEELVQLPVVSHEGYILKDMSAYAEVERIDLDREACPSKVTSDWVGTAGFSGLDLAFSLSTIQMLLALASPLDRLRNGRRHPESAVISDSDNQAQRDAADCKIPDGAIVAIMDLDQHMYMAIEAVESKFFVVGVLHYSIAGERALFKVRHHKRWRSEEQIISFTSLYRPDHNTREICLSYNSGSGFVETSSNSTKPVSLWKILPVQSQKIEDYDINIDDVKSFKLVPENAFHLVNCKSNLGVGFIDGVPEFVKRPGSAFRVKVLQNVLEEVSGPNGNAPSVDVRAENISLTILHEVSDVKDEVPLLRSCMTDFQVVAHSTSAKVRMLGSFNASMQYFNARSDEWKDVVSPVSSSFLFRYRFSDAGPINRIPIRLFVGVKQMNLCINELSVDILLYLAGKLDLFGPYAVRQSAIFPNSCKIENQSGLSLRCHFSSNQDTLIPPRQASSFFLRHLTVLGSENTVLISLVKQGAFSTSPILVSLADTSIFAWRTRITSVNDKRSFPGPFVVIEVSKQREEGLSVSVSPLLRIHNRSEFSIELRFARPSEPKEESAFVTLRSGDAIDESVGLFDAIDLSGGSRKALLSLALGNFLLSFKPIMSKQYLEKYYAGSASADWSEDIIGGKAVRISGVLEKLNYKLRRAFGIDSFNSLFDCLSCPLYIEGIQVSNLYFLVHTVERNVPLQKPLDGGSSSEGNSTSPVALRVQKEIFIYPTVQVHNFLQSEILVILGDSETDLSTMENSRNVGREAVISCGSSSYFYVNPSIIYFSVTLMVNGSKCKPVNSGEWARKLGKQKTEIQYFDMELQFDMGKSSASLRFQRGEKGFLEVVVFTKYTLRNSSDFPLLCTPFYPKSLSRFGTVDVSLPPEHGCLLSPASSASWFAKSTEVYIISSDERSSVARVDVEALSAFTELRLEMGDPSRGNCLLAVLAVSVCPLLDRTVPLPAQVVCIVPRYVIANESLDDVVVRQCYAEDDMDGMFVEAMKKVTLLTRKTKIRGRETLFDSLLRGHKNGCDEHKIFVQFSLKEAGYGWSGPVSVTSLGRFFVKFRRTLEDAVTGGADQPSSKSTRFASVHVVEENNSLVLRYTMPPDSALPYRIENQLPGASIMFFQKESTEVDTLDPGQSAEYIWDDINLPHKLVVRIVDMNLLREISIDKICQWRPFFKLQKYGLGLDLMSLQKGIFPAEKGWFDKSLRRGPLEVGYEVYFDGLTRVLRVCERVNFAKVDNLNCPSANVQLRLASVAFHLRETNIQNIDEAPQEINTLVVSLAYTSVDSVMTDQQKYISTKIQSISAEERWNGASFGSILRRSRDHDASLNENILSVSLVLSSTKSKIKQVEYLSLLLQPIDLKIDEETLMKLVPFWRSSLSDPSAPSQRYYFKHFEIHPIKITASFRPGISHTTYSSAQEALRSLLHTVVKVPPINNSVVELNGVLLNHALVTSRELLLKCAQHYSWYILRAVYVVKGSKLLPPTFASIFDDSALSSLDIFFDPSDGSISLPGVTMGMFKFISKGIKAKGFSGTKRYLGDLGKTIERAGSKALFAAVTEISDNVLRGAETNGFNGMVNGFHQGILRLAMEPSVLGLAIVDGGPDRKIKLDRSPGLDELYIEGYLQGMLDVSYRLEFLRVRVIDDEVILKNLPPSSTVIKEIMENVKSFLVSKGLLKGDAAGTSRPIRQLHTEREWKLGPTMLTLCEHLFVSFAIRLLHKEATKLAGSITWKGRKLLGDGKEKPQGSKIWVVAGFVLSGVVAYIDGRLCRHIPNPIARRIVSGFLLSFLDRKDSPQS